MTTRPTAPESVDPQGTPNLKSNAPSLQSQKLSEIKESNSMAEIYLQNGIRIVGRVLDFDAHGVLMSKSESQSQSSVLTRSMISSVAKTDPENESRRESASPRRPR